MPDRIPGGDLNLVDMGAGGYRTLARGTLPLPCAAIHEGDRVELNGRERYRSGSVIEIGRYEHSTDTIFPCMVVTDIEGDSGDSGGAVLVDGRPAGTTSRVIGRYLAFARRGPGEPGAGALHDSRLRPVAERGSVMGRPPGYIRPGSLARFRRNVLADCSP